MRRVAAHLHSASLPLPLQIYAYVHTAQYVAVDTKQSSDVQDAAAGALVPHLHSSALPPSSLKAGTVAHPLVVGQWMGPMRMQLWLPAWEPPADAASPGAAAQRPALRNLALLCRHVGGLQPQLLLARPWTSMVAGHHKWSSEPPLPISRTPLLTLTACTYALA